mmetsp:Transcript_24403/g.56238  ORF Transcript_24403/g.56238 Transcript_24403/m.56238 type:complete len:691 (+) Transcript_24403:83-2155(+)
MFQLIPESGREYLKLALGVGLLRFLWVRFVQNSFVLKDKAQTAPSSTKTAKAAAGAGELSPEEGVWIYFGSQSGTAEGFANELQEEASNQHGLQAVVKDLEDFDAEVMAKHRCVVLVVATYGEGDPTDNAMDFFRWTKDESLAEDTLKGMQYTIMGLGNRQYVHFNQCAKDADKHLTRLGAKSVYARGEGDDDQNIEEDFEQWKEGGLWAALQAALGEVAAPAGNDENSSSLMTTQDVMSKLLLEAKVFEDQPPVDPLVQVGGADVLGKWYFAASQAPVLVAKELRQQPNVDDGLTTKHIEVDIRGLPALNWKTADNLDVLAENPEREVLWFAKRLGVEEDLDKSVAFVRASGVDKAVRRPFPVPCTIRNALTLFCDLATAPPRRVLRQFAAFVKDEQERAAVTALVEDRDAYQWLTGPNIRFSFMELFAFFFSSAEIDLSTFLQLCPRQRSRPYTISSSSREDSSRIGICVSMVSERLETMKHIVDKLAKQGCDVGDVESALKQLACKLEEPRKFCGACSTMLCTRTAVGDKLWIAVKASRFRLPRSKATPVVMIGAGTGLAPFRAFVREFRAEGGVRSRTSLYFGCWRADQDFIYKDELEEAMQLSPPALSELITAFSREQEKKVYVQHRLEEKRAHLKALINDGAYIFVCGSTAMGDSVREQMAAAMESKDALKRLEDQGRFVTELW